MIPCPQVNCDEKSYRFGRITPTLPSILLIFAEYERARSFETQRKVTQYRTIDDYDIVGHGECPVLYLITTISKEGTANGSAKAFLRLGDSIDLIVELAYLNSNMTYHTRYSGQMRVKSHHRLLDTLIKISKEAPDLVKVLTSSWDGKGMKPRFEGIGNLYIKPMTTKSSFTRYTNYTSLLPIKRSWQQKCMMT